MLILLLLFAGNCGDSLKPPNFSNSYSNSVFVCPLLTNICLNLFISWLNNSLVEQILCALRIPLIITLDLYLPGHSLIAFNNLPSLVCFLNTSDTSWPFCALIQMWHMPHGIVLLATPKNSLLVTAFTQHLASHPRSAPLLKLLRLYQVPSLQLSPSDFYAGITLLGRNSINTS